MTNIIITRKKEGKFNIRNGGKPPKKEETTRRPDFLFCVCVCMSKYKSCSLYFILNDTVDTVIEKKIKLMFLYNIQYVASLRN